MNPAIRVQNHLQRSKEHITSCEAAPNLNSLSGVNTVPACFRVVNRSTAEVRVGKDYKDSCTSTVAKIETHCRHFFPHIVIYSVSYENFERRERTGVS